MQKEQWRSPSTDAPEPVRAEQYNRSFAKLPVETGWLPIPPARCILFLPGFSVPFRGSDGKHRWNYITTIIDYPEFIDGADFWVTHWSKQPFCRQGGAYGWNLCYAATAGGLKVDLLYLLTPIVKVNGNQSWERINNGVAYRKLWYSACADTVINTFNRRLTASGVLSYKPRTVTYPFRLLYQRHPIYWLFQSHEYRFPTIQMTFRYGREISKEKFLHHSAHSACKYKSRINLTLILQTGQWKNL